MTLKERMERRKREGKDIIASLTDAEFYIWRQFRDVLASSDPDAVAFRCEVRAEHRRLARRRGKILQLGQQMRRMRQRKGARRG